MRNLPEAVLAKWPRLMKLQAEVAELERQHQQAAAKVAQLEAQLPAARDRDLEQAAKALRAGKKQPEATHEAELQEQLEAARRNRRVYERAAATAQTDLSAFVSEHRDGLFRGVVEHRRSLAEEMAGHARALLALYGGYCDMAYNLKDLAAPAPPHDENAPAGPTVSVVGVQTARPGHPERGKVEEALSYVVSLAGDEAGGASGAT